MGIKEDSTNIYMYNTRYWFLKKIYPNYLLLFKTNKNKLGYRCFEIDKYILDSIRHYSINFNIIQSRLDKLNINYMLIDNLSITKIKTFNTNMYNDYMYKCLVLNILDRIRVCVFR